MQGLEISKSGQNPNFISETNFLENDSGVEFNSTFPLDSDTDQSSALHKPLIDSLAVIPPTISEDHRDASFTPDSVLSVNEQPEHNNTEQEADLMGTNSPGPTNIQSLNDVASSGTASSSVVECPPTDLYDASLVGGMVPEMAQSGGPYVSN